MWSRALNESEVDRAFSDRIDVTDTRLSLFYNFDEGLGSIAKNSGRAGANYDLILGAPPGGQRPTSYEVDNKYGGVDNVMFTAPTWSQSTAKRGSQGVSVLQEGCGSLQNGRSLPVGAPRLTATAKTVFVKEGMPASFILEYFHSVGRKSCLHIKRLPKHGKLVQTWSTAKPDHVLPITIVPFNCSSHAYAMLVRLRGQ